MSATEHISYWNQTGKKTDYPRLEGDMETEALIIGGGITGITCAYCLAQMGKEAALIEAGGLCDGTTGNTTGKVTIQHDIIYSEIEKKYGEKSARLYMQSQTEALRFVRDAVENESIDCALAENTAYIFAGTPEELYALEREYQTAVRLGIETEWIENPDFPPGALGLLGFKNQLVFHPVRYAQGLAKTAAKKGARLYCDTKAIQIEEGAPNIVRCENHLTIRAKYLVMATQYPIYDGLNLFFTRLYPNRTYGIAVKAQKDWPDGSYINIQSPSRSIRTHVERGKRVLIVVGEGHPTARGDQNMENHVNNLISFADSVAGVDEVMARWSAQDYETPDKIPYIGRITEDSNIFIASGFRKWGLSNGTLAGNLIAELIAKGASRYEELYSLKRSDIAKAPGKFISKNANAVGELIKSKIEDTESLRGLQREEGKVIRYNGHRAGIYRDADDNVTVLDITCTHMTTKLNFNNAAKTWDCPAHGGRYAIDGKLLEGPPKHPLKILYQGKYSDLLD